MSGCLIKLICYYKPLNQVLPHLQSEIFWDKIVSQNRPFLNLAVQCAHFQIQKSLLLSICAPVMFACFIMHKKAVDRPKHNKHLAKQAAEPVQKGRAAFHCYKFAQQSHRFPAFLSQALPLRWEATPTQGNFLLQLAKRTNKKFSCF